jgi:hypothetical protein
MNIRETAIDPDLRCELDDWARRGVKLLGLDPGHDSAGTIIKSIDRQVFEMQQGRGRLVDLAGDEDAVVILGSAWGAQLVRELGWQWSSVVFHDHGDIPAVGVFSVDRSLAIYPMHFIFGCLEHASPVTIALALTVLKDGSRVPPLPPGSFENVMEHIEDAKPRR